MKLVLTVTLSSFFGDDSSLIRWELIRVCTRLQGRSIGGGGLSSGGSGWLDRGRKDSRMLLLHFFGGLLLGSFLTTSSSSGIKSRLGLVDDVEESSVVVSVWQEVAWAGYTEGPKLIARCCFLLLRRCT